MAQQVEVSINQKPEFRCVAGYLERTEVLRKPFVKPRREVCRETLHQQVGVFVVNGSEVVASTAGGERDVVHVSRAQEISADFDSLPVEPGLVGLVCTLIAKDDDDDGRSRPVLCERRERARDRRAKLLEAKCDIPDLTGTRITEQQEVLGSQRGPLRGSRRCGDEDAGGGRQE